MLNWIMKRSLGSFYYHPCGTPFYLIIHIEKLLSYASKNSAMMKKYSVIPYVREEVRR